MREVTATGSSVEEATRSGLEKLGASRDAVNVDVIDEGKKGLLGIFGSKPAIVKVRLSQDKVKEGEEFIRQVAEQMGVSVDITTERNGKEIGYKLSGKDIAVLIGKRGQTLNSLQYLVQLVVNRDNTQYYTVLLDAEGYRERRKETLQQLANRLADKAIRTMKEVHLEPMPSYERKIIHTALHDHPKVQTYSDGVDPRRKVIIKPENN
ncbi:RNA-binding cell elongation regulator Jag/EloR [Salirhabdus salicampi]|uniref:RNA-binding cell elongation regulator Jag/EloR n=1 Tax=Salirhabdus salicampi TaxID=476102 RepID=UPI0020C38AFB|nr:protein jag [Salirhabdus salicampi]